MFRLNDLILLIVIFSSVLGGIVFPSVASVFRPCPVYLVMLLLFLSFSSISLGDVRDTLRHQTPTLLLTGTSTGVVAPFISTIVRANVHLVVVVVISSVLVPFTLPALVNLGVSSGYSDFFFQNPATILEAVCVAIALGGIYLWWESSCRGKGLLKNGLPLSSSLETGTMSWSLCLPRNSSAPWSRPWRPCTCSPSLA